MTARGYFGRSATGVNNDIQRHRERESELLAKIADLESRDRDEFEERALTAYRYFLNQLRQSKAEAVNKLGKKS